MNAVQDNHDPITLASACGGITASAGLSLSCYIGLHLLVLAHELIELCLYLYYDKVRDLQSNIVSLRQMLYGISQIKWQYRQYQLRVASVKVNRSK